MGDVLAASTRLARALRPGTLDDTIVSTPAGRTDAGDEIDYTFTVTNTGNVPVPVSYVIVTDPTATVTAPLTPEVIAPGATVNWTAVSNAVVGPAQIGRAHV